MCEADFRDVGGQCDNVVPIGALERAGRDRLADVVRAHADLLKPGLAVRLVQGRRSIDPESARYFFLAALGRFAPCVSGMPISMEIACAARTTSGMHLCTRLVFIR